MKSGRRIPSHDARLDDTEYLRVRDNHMAPAVAIDKEVAALRPPAKKKIAGKLKRAKRQKEMGS